MPAAAFPRPPPVVKEPESEKKPEPEPEKISKHKDWARSKLWTFIRNKHIRYMYDNNLIENKVGFARP